MSAAFGRVAPLEKDAAALRCLLQIVAQHRREERVGKVRGNEERAWTPAVAFILDDRAMKWQRTVFTVKYADYTARAFGSDTQKFWLQIDFAL